MNWSFLLPLLLGLLAIAGAWVDVRSESRRELGLWSILCGMLLVGMMWLDHRETSKPLEPGKPYIRSRIIQTP